MGDLKPTGVTYKSGVHEKTGWEILQVIYHAEDPATGAKRVTDSFVIARAQDGTVLRKIDIVLDHWERITDEDDLRYFLSRFENRDKLIADEIAKSEKSLVRNPH